MNDEIVMKIKEIEERIMLLESEIANIRRDVTQALEMMSVHFSNELNSLLDDYKASFTKTTLEILGKIKNNN